MSGVHISLLNLVATHISRFSRSKVIQSMVTHAIEVRQRRNVWLLWVCEVVTFGFGLDPENIREAVENLPTALQALLEYALLSIPIEDFIHAEGHLGCGQ
jgi:hypothetical protein